MSKFSFRMAGLLALATTCASISGVAAETPKPADILFERPHIASVAPGTELVYKFVRKPSDERALGLGFTDNVTVKVEHKAMGLTYSEVVPLKAGQVAKMKVDMLPRAEAATK